MKKITIKKQWKSGSGRTFVKSQLIIAFLLVAFHFNSNAQVKTGKEVAIKNAEVALSKAQVILDKIERQLVISDSLIVSGQNMIKEATTELKNIELESKKLEKEDNVNRKPLEKQLRSKDRDESKQAMVEIKKLDALVKTNFKESTNKLKIANKQRTVGEANLSKGKSMKSIAQSGLKAAKSNVKLAQEKLDKANKLK